MLGQKIRSFLVGFGSSAFFAVGSLALVVLQSFLGLTSWWWPFSWPMLLFGVVGIPFLPLVDTKLFGGFVYMIIPEGGAPGVILVLVSCGFVFWGVVFSVIVHFWPRIRLFLTKMRTKTIR